MGRFYPFSPKQLQLLSWWHPERPTACCEAVICDGAVRSGKSLCMFLSFFGWAFQSFDGADFALCGKTIASLRRNVVSPLMGHLGELGFVWQEKLSRNYVDVSFQGRSNRFYLFGGKDESSAALIQGMTLAGVLFDEVALMPRSFVEQALARCSVEGSKFWFNCNPEHPYHWFYQEWILKCREKHALYLHFTMEDNPSLSPAMRERYRSLYSGAFYERFVLGRWVAASGLVYPMFQPDRHVKPAPEDCEEYYISCDYGTVNPASFGLWGRRGTVWHRMREYYYDSRIRGAQRTDEEHYAQLEQLAGGLPIRAVLVDPSAASFQECIRRHGRFPVKGAKNDVLDGIRRVADALNQGEILFDPSCQDTLREFQLYRWNPNTGQDAPIKEHDHAMDDIRYFVMEVLNREDTGFAALSLPRAARFSPMRKGGI